MHTPSAHEIELAKRYERAMVSLGNRRYWSGNEKSANAAWIASGGANGWLGVVALHGCVRKPLRKSTPMRRLRNRGTNQTQLPTETTNEV